jgi:hypothetical protein
VRRDDRHRNYWRRLRAHIIGQALISPEPPICWRCEMPISRDELRRGLVDLGHVVDHALMTETDVLRVRLEHRACSRAAGLALGQELTRTRPAHRVGQYESRGLR